MISKAYELEDAILSFARAGIKIGFTFLKKNGSHRYVAPTDRIVYKNNALRFFDVGINDWRSASDGTILSVRLNDVDYTDANDLPNL